MTGMTDAKNIFAAAGVSVHSSAESLVSPAFAAFVRGPRERAWIPLGGPEDAMA